MTSPAEELLPLKPTAFHILAALAEGGKHGYAIRKAVERESGGLVEIRIGSLYSLLHGLLDAGLIEETDPQDGDVTDARRRTYCLTSLGMNVLTAEVKRLRATLVSLEAKGLFQGLQSRGGNAL